MVGTPAPGADPMPRRIKPMKATTGVLPDDADDGWAYEVKWDGVRAIGFVDEDGGLCLQSSNELDITARYPELAPLGAELGGRTAVLDGEVVTFNAEGRPDFGLLQQRMHLTGAKAVGEWAARQPVVWVLFDLLYLDGHLLYEEDRTAGRGTAMPYRDRRRLLEGLIGNGPNWQVAPAQTSDGAALFDAIAERGMEGIIAKRLASTYVPGRRTPEWRKVKVRRRQEFVVGGWRPGAGSRADAIGALLVGHHDEDGRLVYAGRVGTGFTQPELRRLGALFDDLARESCPFDPVPPRAEAKDAHWVDPTIVVEVAFGEWSTDQRLRHPSYLGQRDDKDPEQVVREPG